MVKASPMKRGDVIKVLQPAHVGLVARQNDDETVWGLMMFFADTEEKTFIELEDENVTSLATTMVDVLQHEGVIDVEDL